MCMRDVSLAAGHARRIFLQSVVGLQEVHIVKPIGKSSRAKEAGSRFATTS